MAGTGPENRRELRSYALLTLLVVVVIVHGSLYPYDFTVRNGRGGPVEELLRTWADPPRDFGDLLGNLLLYMPFGFFFARSLRIPAARRSVLVTVSGLALCVTMELAQFFAAHHVTNMSDVYLNTAGTLIGAGGALVIEGRPAWPFLEDIAERPFPFFVLVAAVGLRLFSYAPAAGARYLTPSWYYFIVWLVTCFMIESVVSDKRSRGLGPLVFIIVITTKMVISAGPIGGTEILAAGIAFLIWPAVLAVGYRRAAGIVAALLCLTIVVQRLEPFALRAAPTPFGWIPFRSFMIGSVENNVRSFLEKFVEYGGLIWLLKEAGLRLWLSSGFVVPMLFATSIVQMHLPRRSGEITDAVMALMIAAVLRLMGPPPGQDKTTQHL